MQNSFILFLVSLLTALESVSGGCPNIINKIYQTTNQKSGEPKPWYGFLLFLPNGIAAEANNIAGGNSANSLGVNLTFGVHFGYYTCLNNNVVHLTDISYIYTTPGVSYLSQNGGTLVHDYHLQFSGHDDNQGMGSVQIAVYKTGTNPFDPSNKPVVLSGNDTSTCRFMNGKNFQFPTAIQ